MPSRVRIELLPLGATLTVPPGTALQDLLFTQGVEFPCGGRGRCKGCRIRVLEGHLPVTEEDARLLNRGELDNGWRLACRARPTTDLKVEFAQWEALILADDSKLSFTPRQGLGVAVDLGTTTIVAQLVDLANGNVLGVRTALNDQARHGADIMSRVDFAVHGSERVLQKLIREQIGSLVGELIAPGHAGELQDVVVVGNTVMHHLFCGVSVEPLSQYPFLPEEDGLKVFDPAELGWDLARNGNGVKRGAKVHFLPCLGGFVGSDILAGVLAVALHESERPAALIDLGTNGEIVVGNRQKMLCSSTAAGPAFEGARISMGMRAATGAISEVTWRDGEFHCHVLGGVDPRGICGSGLVDAVATALKVGRIDPSGRLVQGESMLLKAPVALNQKDVRELQLAKGAIAAGLRLLLERWGAEPKDLARVYLAGAFGNYISRTNAQRIGLVSFPPEQVEAAGNTALRGAKLALFALPEEGSYGALRARIEHVPLNEDERFQDVFVDEMRFPE